jgi:hypothetical protein
MHVRVRRLRASRSVAVCGIDGQELAAHADRYMLAVRSLVASLTTGVAGSCGQPSFAGILEG